MPMTLKSERRVTSPVDIKEDFASTMARCQQGEKIGPRIKSNMINMM